MSKQGSIWTVDATNTEEVTLQIDDLDGDGSISNDEWDAAVNGGGNDTGGTGYLYTGTGSSGTLYSTDGLTTFSAGQDVSTTVDGLTNTFETDVSGVVCFVKGTQLKTPTGYRPVESLSAGDLVWTLDRGHQPIRWVGRKSVLGFGRCAPVRIEKGAMGNRRDLWVSQQHRMLVSGWQTELLFGLEAALVPAVHLANQKTVSVVNRPTVTYYHLLFDHHEIVDAEGCLSESFLPGQFGLTTMSPDAHAELLELFPEIVRCNGTWLEPARTSLKAYEGRLIGVT